LNSTPKSKNQSYTQAFKNNINEIIKIKDAFLKLSPNEISEIHNVMNSSNQREKPKLNMITKSSSRKQIIIPMETNNVERVMAQSNIHIANINRLLKDIKSKISADYICSDNKRVVIITNKVTTFSDLNVVEKYMKELNNVDSNNIMSSRLPQSKSYLKILGIPYFTEDTNLSVTLNIIERVIKSTHIFDDIVLASQSRVIKTSPKFDMAVVWVNI